ncbi:outer membrane beta-barrel protein [Helicobacter mesocricetorum]|uniref:outer membrane beta-barrel protein n=1 Tax=Helicobacter mesocricetorum TaxID=87012 RepID=UPI0013150A8E|nr:outer membrane beta-barrel protein [Helicobacter mesocricetorum]
MMKFINRLGIVSGLFVAVFGINVLANESQGFFLGADGGYGKTKIQQEEFDLNIKDKVSNFGLRAGYRLSPEHRAYIAYYHQSKIKDTDNIPVIVSGNVIANIPVESKYRAHRAVIGYDFTPKLSENIRGVLGAYGGYSFLNVNTESNFFGDIFSLPSAFDGLIYGAKMGFLYELGRVEVELGVKLEQIRYKTRDLKLSFDVGGTKTDVLNENIKPMQTTGGMYLGFNYKF